MRRRGIKDIDRELSLLATANADIRRQGGEVTALVIDGLLDERLLLYRTSEEPPTEEFVQVQLPDPTESRKSPR
jgi:hypothetical protein